MLVSLNAHDRHALDLIEAELASSDPQFAAKLSAFSRLANGGTMPERERIRAGRWLSLATVAVWLVVSLGLLGVALVASHIGAGPPCAQWQAAVCADGVDHHVPLIQRGGSPARAP
jgi:Protein of unknown function (DUF3040)